MNNEQEMRAAFDRWFTELGKIGDPLRRPGLVREAFESGAEWQRCQIKTKEAFAVLDLMDKETSLNFPSPEWSLEVPTHEGWWWKRRAHLVLDDGSFTWHKPTAVFVREMEGELRDTSWSCPENLRVNNGEQWWPLPITPPTGGK